MFVSLSSFSTTDLESWRETLNLLLITSTLAVCIGVHFEKDGNPQDVQEYGWSLVRRGIAIEFALAILLWQLDSAIGIRQKSDIAVLFDRATKAELELAKIRTPRKLTPVQMQKFVATLRQHSGKGFWVMTQKTASANFGEQIDFGRQVSEAFALAGWEKTANSNRNDPKETTPETTEVSDRGCLIAAAAGANGLALLKVVSDGLNEADIECSSTEDYSLIPDFIFVEIGLR